MINKKKSRSEQAIPSIIAGDCKVSGNIVSNGSIEIIGNVEGDITSRRIAVHRFGTVRGDVLAESIEIGGSVYGTIRARSVVITGTAAIYGNLMYDTMIVAAGAFIEGACSRVNVSAIDVECQELLDNVKTECIDGANKTECIDSVNKITESIED